jgi:hypothetical protein
MKSLIRKTSTSGRIGGTLVAASALLLPGTLLTLPDGATAQELPVRPDITIYHSLDQYGADPRSESVPPGCTSGGGGVPETVINFDDAAQNQVVNDYYEGVTFSSIGDNEVRADAQGASIIPSTPHSAVVYTALGGSAANQDFFADFDPPVDNLRFTVWGDNEANSAQVTVYYGIESSVTETIPTDGLVNTVHVVDLSEYTGVTRIAVTNITEPSGIGYDDFHFGAGDGPPVCVLQGGIYEELKLWINGGSTYSNDEGEELCSRGGGGGENSAGSGDELCGAALTFQIQGVGRFKAAIESDLIDVGIETMVLGTPCSFTGEGDECFFPENPPLKKLTLNFRRGEGGFPAPGPRFLGSLIIDSTGPNAATDVSEISVNGEAAGAALQSRLISTGNAPEVIATLPEPGQFVQLLTGLFGLAGLHRLRRKHK